MTAALPSVTLAASLLALAAQANGQDPAGKTPVDAKPPAPAAPATAEDFVERARTQLAAIGYVVPATIHSEQRTKAEALADLDAQQDLLMPADSFAAQFALLGAFRRPLPKDAAKLRKLTMVAMTQGLSAYYECRRKTFVMLDSTTRDVAEALAGSLLPLVAHELVHACQDARDGGIAGRFDPAHGTLDLAMARRCALEGEAEIASFLALQGPDAASRLTAMRAASKVEGLLAGELTGLIYAVGRELALARHAAGGLDAVRAVWQTPPASTEQVMHPAKYGVDVPTAVVLPAVDGCKAATRTTIGELLTFNVLRQIGVARDDAAIAAAGWDGDEMVVYEADGQPGSVCAWRTVWDRAEDAADFAGRIDGHEFGTVATAGRIVDFVAGPAELRDRVAAVLQQHREQPAEVAADIASTVAAEAELRANADHSAVEGSVWRLDDLGLSVPVPDGWRLEEINGLKMLIDPESAKRGFARNANVMALPRGDAKDLAALVEGNRAQLEQMHMTVDGITTEKRGETEVLICEYHGKIGRMPAVHAILLIYLRGDQQVVMTATGKADAWDVDGPMLRKLIESVTIAPQ